jgi:hypothetical protein
MELPDPLPLHAWELTPEQRRELIRRFLADPQAQERATEHLLRGLAEDAAAE